MMSIHEQLYRELLGVAGALAISVFVLLGLVLRLRETAPPRMHIWAMIAFFSVNIADGLNSFAYSDVGTASNTFFRWNDAIIPGFMVSLYFFVRALTSARPALAPRDAVHAAPFVLSAACLAPALILPGDTRRALFSDMAVPDTITSAHLQLVTLGETLFWVLWIVWLTLYGAICIRRLVIHKRNIRALFSDLEGRTLRWLDGLVATILLLALFVIVDEIRLLLGAGSWRNGAWAMAFDVVLPLSFGVFALRANPVLPGWTQQVLRPDMTPEPQAPPGPSGIAKPPPLTQGVRKPAPQGSDRPVLPSETASAAGHGHGQGHGQGQRYARSGLQPADLDRLAARLEKRMTERRLWRDHGLNLRGLAAEIAVPAIHLSEVLNTRLGLSFYDYVNQCRIKDACELLIQSDDTILEISETVGFNAKSTFNTSFRKVTDQTPSQWRARHRP